MSDKAALYALKVRIVALEAGIALAELEIKGGAGSGNWGHAGRAGKRGGSVSRGMAMSRTSGRDASVRQSAAKLSKHFNDEDSKKLVRAFRTTGNIEDSAKGEKMLYEAALEFKKAMPNKSNPELLSHAMTALKDPKGTQVQIEMAKESNKKLKDSMALAGDAGGWRQQTIDDNNKMITALQNTLNLNHQSPSTDINTSGFINSTSTINLSKKYKSLVDRGVIKETKQVKGTSKYELTELGKKLHGQI